MRVTTLATRGPRAGVALLVLVTLGTAAQAQQAGRTREEVLRELAEARRNGEMIISGCGGGTFREAFPNKYPPRAASPTTPVAGAPGAQAFATPYAAAPDALQGRP